MEVKLSQAVKMFFGNSSLEMVYIEAIANSFDAGATEINISIRIANFNKPETLAIEISDNGEGFTDERVRKFGRLFDVDESSHKGLGRLVYVCYFDDVIVTSNFEKTKFRFFKFDENFDSSSSKISIVDEQPSGATIRLSKYTFSKVKSHAYLKPKDLKNRILEEFYVRLFQYKLENKKILINITLFLDDFTLNESLSLDDIADLKMVEFNSTSTFFDVLRLYYSIEKVELGKENFIAALSIDNRTKQIDLLATENIPFGYKMVFLLFSDLFNGKIDHTRVSWSRKTGQEFNTFKISVT